MPDLLACPSCRHLLVREPASLRCSCSLYPVVEGIPIVTDWARNRTFTTEQVLARYLPPPRGVIGKLLRRIAPETGALRSAISDGDATFIDLAAVLGRVADLDYFRYRFSDLSYLASAALLTPLAKGPVLDLGCGAGHLLRVLAARIPGELMVGLDLNFSLLYLARRFLAPAALLVCADASLPLPFVDGAFEASVCADVYQYLPDPARTSVEMLRITRGPIVLSHLWTSAFGDRSGLPPERYREFFSSRNGMLHDDGRLIETFLRTRELDLSRTSGLLGNALSLTVGLEPKVYPGADYFVSGTELNPIYDVREDAAGLRLRRKFISDHYAKVYRAVDEFLPEILTVTRDQLASRDPELVRKFVLLDLPPLYC
jgi:SAM-dependent methyltransferase/uncharacterized protein YbaR (Trm112 family)